jgi:predicted DNA-binding protein
MKEKSRLTVDMSTDQHMHLKMACANLGVSMKDFLIVSAFEKMEEIEDEWLAKKATETLEKIKQGKEKLISWKEMKKRIDS